MVNIPLFSGFWYIPFPTMHQLPDFRELENIEDFPKGRCLGKHFWGTIYLQPVGSPTGVWSPRDFQGSFHLRKVLQGMKRNGNPRTHRNGGFFFGGVLTTTKKGGMKAKGICQDDTADMGTNSSLLETDTSHLKNSGRKTFLLKWPSI